MEAWTLMSRSGVIGRQSGHNTLTHLAWAYAYGHDRDTLFVAGLYGVYVFIALIIPFGSAKSVIIGCFLMYVALLLCPVSICGAARHAVGGGCGDRSCTTHLERLDEGRFFVCVIIAVELVAPGPLMENVAMLGKFWGMGFWFIFLGVLIISTGGLGLIVTILMLLWGCVLVLFSLLPIGGKRPLFGSAGGSVSGSAA